MLLGREHEQREIESVNPIVGSFTAERSRSQ